MGSYNLGWEKSRKDLLVLAEHEVQAKAGWRENLWALVVRGRRGTATNVAAQLETDTGETVAVQPGPSGHPSHSPP